MKINVKTSSNNYDILIEKGIFSCVAEEIKAVTKANAVFVVTDENVDKFYGEAMKKQLTEQNITFNYIVLPFGEHTKSHEMLIKLYDAFLQAGLSRKDYIIAFGGGVIGDLTGYAAATYLRGVKFIQIPTTLLSQVDSSVGGKVAVNLTKGKNLVGCFYPPTKVIIDPDMLKTLPKRVFNDGMAEVIKYGAIRDEKLFNTLLHGGDIEEIITTCVSIKKQVVENDEFDTGERMILNFGHTYGHVVECYYNYDKYTHGEGVAIGMIKITAATEDRGITEKGTTQKLIEVCKKYDLYFPEVEIDSEKAKEIMLKDKKSEKDVINYVAITKIGQTKILTLPKDEVLI